MTFIEFCMAQGIMITHPPRLGMWERYPTESHPKKRNGAVKWMGDHGFLQDHAVHTEVIFWRENTPIKIDPRVTMQALTQAAEERKRLQENAEMRASMILNRCVYGRHDYLRKKGFPDEKGLVWCHDQTEHLVIPMYDEESRLIGMQTIDADGNKKFLYGQKTKGAEYLIGRQGPDILCEGYATGLSIRSAMQSLKHIWRIHICFSANNLLNVASRLKPGLVVADNDASGTGEAVAKKTGWRYWMSPKTGQDFNDYHQEKGLFAAAQSLWRSMYPGTAKNRTQPDTLASSIEERKAVHKL
jgi:putative DNA primase/helicase